MMPAERERIYALCAQIVEEKDRDRFTKLVKELNELLDRKEERLAPTGENSNRLRSSTDLDHL
jgi:hypothetical protein